MNSVSIEDVPAGNHADIVVANEGVVRALSHSELSNQDALEGTDSRMGVEIVSQSFHREVVESRNEANVANALDVDVDVGGSHWTSV